MIRKEIKLSLPDKKRFEIIQKTLITWYKKNRREFSWRKKIRDPYEVMVCEIMGQQTQASRIEQFLPRFLKKFPTIQALASAKKSDVIRQWQGLGYNRRALNMQKAAIELSNKPFPKTESELLALPGIGPYTARAILIFSYNKSIPTVDVNIERVISRLYSRMPDTNTMLAKKDILSIAEVIIPIRQSRLWHEALMDFGATICTKRNPKCSECPLFDNCKSGKTLILKDTVSTPKKLSSEPKYFGQPKRIWRGKVLKLISVGKGLTEAFIIKQLIYSEKKSEFVPFIHAVLQDLVKEGFCTLSPGKSYYLHD